MDYGGITRGSFVGEAQVALSELREQTIQDVWLDLYEKNGVRTQGQLNVKLHWIHSKVLFIAKQFSKLIYLGQILCFSSRKVERNLS